MSECVEGRSHETSLSSRKTGMINRDLEKPPAGQRLASMGLQEFPRGRSNRQRSVHAIPRLTSVHRMRAHNTSLPLLLIAQQYDFGQCCQFRERTTLSRRLTARIMCNDHIDDNTRALRGGALADDGEAGTVFRCLPMATNTNDDERHHVALDVGCPPLRDPAWPQCWVSRIRYKRTIRSAFISGSRVIWQFRMGNWRSEDLAFA
jgi:hypothetical protein